MSRAFPNTVLRTSLGLGAAVPVQFLRFAFGGGDIRVTTAPFDIDWDGFTWQGIGGALRFDRLQESSDDRGGQITLALSGVDQSLLSAILAEQYIGRVVEIWFGWVAQHTNLHDNAGYETDLNGVVAAGATLSRVASPVWEGESALQVAMTVSAADQGVTAFDLKGGAWLPVTAGYDYAFGLMARMADGSGPRQLKLEVNFYTATSGTNVGGLTSDIRNLTSGGWTEFQSAGRVPATATVARLRFRSVAATGLYSVFVDGVRYHPGLVLGPYQPTDGAPIIGGTILDRPLQVFSGFMNGGFEVTETPGEREGSGVEIEGKVVSSLASLLQPQGLRTNLESHQAIYRLDRFFEYVPGLAGKSVTWGWTKKELLARVAGAMITRSGGRL